MSAMTLFSSRHKKHCESSSQQYREVVLCVSSCAFVKQDASGITSAVSTTNSAARWVVRNIATDPASQHLESHHLAMLKSDWKHCAPHAIT